MEEENFHIPEKYHTVDTKGPFTERETLLHKLEFQNEEFEKEIAALKNKIFEIEDFIKGLEIKSLHITEEIETAKMQFEKEVNQN